nr:uncharacterized protein LOC129485750 [Symphalangus syndactylus]
MQLSEIRTARFPVCLCVCRGRGGGGGPCLRFEPLVPTRRVSHRTVAKTSPEPRGSEKSRPKAPAEASSLGRTPARAAERSPPPGSQLLQLPLKFAVAAASSRFNPRPPVIGQLLRGKKSTPWQPDKPIKSPAGVTAATLQAGVGWAEEQSGHCAQNFTRKGEMSEMEITQSCLEAEDSARAHLETPSIPQYNSNDILKESISKKMWFEHTELHNMSKIGPNSSVLQDCSAFPFLDVTTLLRKEEKAKICSQGDSSMMESPKWKSLLWLQDIRFNK